MFKRHRRLFLMMAWVGPLIGLIIGVTGALLFGKYQGEAFFDVEYGSELRSDETLWKHAPKDAELWWIAEGRMTNDEYLRQVIDELDLMKRWGKDERSAKMELKNSIKFESAGISEHGKTGYDFLHESPWKALKRWWDYRNRELPHTIVLKVHRADSDEALEITGYIANGFVTYCEVLEERDRELEKREEERVRREIKEAARTTTEAMDELLKQGDGIDPLHGMSEVSYSAACAAAIVNGHAASERLRRSNEWDSPCLTGPTRFELKKDAPITVTSGNQQLFVNSFAGILGGFLLSPLIALLAILFSHRLSPTTGETLPPKPVITGDCG